MCFDSKQQRQKVSENDLGIYLCLHLSVQAKKFFYLSCQVYGKALSCWSLTISAYVGPLIEMSMKCVGLISKVKIKYTHVQSNVFKKVSANEWCILIDELFCVYLSEFFVWNVCMC